MNRVQAIRQLRHAPVQVMGPVPEVEEEIALLHRGFWQAA